MSSISTSMSMWEDKYEEFQIDVGEGWQLFLSEDKSFPVKPGHTYGRLSTTFHGLELRKDTHFISSKPLYVVMDDPHPQSLTLYSANQTVLYRDDCTGYAPWKLWSKKNYIEEHDYHADDDNDDYCYSSDEDDVPNYDRFIALPNNDEAKFNDCMFLGMKPPHGVNLCLKTVIPKGLYAIHTLLDVLIGYLITVGIYSPDLKRFHSDEGYYEIAVISSNDNTRDFMAFLGCQNELNSYQLDCPRLKDRIDIKDLSQFDRHDAQKYWTPSRPNYKYVNLCKSGGVMETYLNPGFYCIQNANARKMKSCKYWGTRNEHGAHCGLTGEDNEGNRYDFPGEAFDLIKVEKRGSRTIHLPQGSYASIWDGNIKIKKKGGGIFRMYTNLCSVEYGMHNCGDMSEYDIDPEKTLQKLEAAMKKAYEEYMKLPE